MSTLARQLCPRATQNVTWHMMVGVTNSRDLNYLFIRYSFLDNRKRFNVYTDQDKLIPRDDCRLKPLQIEAFRN